MINRTPMYIVLTLCLITVYTLFNIKDNVMTLRMELKEVSKQIQHEHDTIRILKAEFAYLTSPARLSRLNKDYLKLKETTVSQMIQDPANPLTEENTKKLANSKLRTKNVKWRYKKGPSKYLTLVADKKTH